MFIKDQSGMALPTTIIIIVVLTLLGVALFRYSMAETKQVHWDENALKAHYLARSGADAVAAHLINNPRDAEQLINEESGLTSLGDGQFRVFITGDPDDEMHIQSTGLVGPAEQTVVLTLADDGPPAVYSNGDITVYGAFKLFNGDFAYKSRIVSQGGQELTDEDIEEHAIDGNVYQKYLDLDQVVLPCDDDTEKALFYGTCPTEPGTIDVDSITGNEDTVTETGYYGDFRLGSGGKTNHLTIKPPESDNLLFKAGDIDIGNNTLEIALNNNTVAIVANDLDIGGNGIIDVNGSGDLLIYVTGDFKSRGTFETVKEDDVNVYFFIDDEGSFDLSGNVNFDGVVYSPNADVSIDGNVNLYGWVIGENVELGGNAKVHYISGVSLPDGMFLDFRFYRVEKYRYDY